MAETIVQLRDVKCKFGDTLILDVPALSIVAGERVALIGQNGAGKSTLLRLLTGFAHPRNGQVLVLGTDVAQLRGNELCKLRAQVGQVLQGLHLVARLSVRENVLIGALSRIVGWRGWTRFYPADELARADAALRDVGMFDHAQTRADQLSGGERQKVAIARILVQAPRLILADEPTAALDPRAAQEVCDLLAACAHHATLVSVIHNPSLLPILADRVIGLKNGRIFFDLPVAAIDDARLTALYEQASPSEDRRFLTGQHVMENCYE